MMTNINSQYLKLEVPELENRESLSEHFNFKIYGIEKERPLIRINNNFYQGKWIVKKNFIVFTKKETTISNLLVQMDPFLFEDSLKVKIRKIKLKKEIKSSDKNLETFATNKKLRLYRLPLIIKSL
jgi:hypothetical protein